MNNNNNYIKNQADLLLFADNNGNNLDEDSSICSKASFDLIGEPKLDLNEVKYHLLLLNYFNFKASLLFFC
jgi:hypothetical protein